jgi:hypothetical protein
VTKEKKEQKGDKGEEIKRVTKEKREQKGDGVDSRQKESEIRLLSIYFGRESRL